MTAIRFEEPPLSARPPYSKRASTKDAALLMERPGEWAVIREPASRMAAYAMAYQIRRGILAGFRPAGAFEAMGRTVNGTYRVYARYIGTDGEHR
jgi:hypothetical protein